MQNLGIAKDDSIEIFVRTTAGNHLTLHVKDSDTIDDVRALIDDKDCRNIIINYNY